jgi:hypothetical protein
MPHDPPPWAGRVEIVTVEVPVKVPVEVPAAGSLRFDQLAFGAAAGLAVGLFWTTAIGRRQAVPKP